MKDWFTFGDNFTAYFTYGICEIEQYSEGRETLHHITTIEQFNELKKILTGE